LAVILVAALPVGCRRPLAPSVSVEHGERLLVIAPHPDDETLGAGGLIQRVTSAHGTVRVVLVTAGDGYVEAVRYETGKLRPRAPVYVAYGERRLREARAAVRKLGGDGVRVGLLGFPDGGLEQLLQAHWWRDVPERSPTTRAMHPPYREALDRTVAYDGDDLRRELVRVLRETRPTTVAFPDPLDRHPDHSATGIFVLLALGDQLARDGRVPRLLAYLVHWPGWPPGWDDPQPAPEARERPLDFPPDLPDRGLARVALPLSRTEIDGKAAALECYVTQQEVMSSLLAAFVRRTEPFTVFTVAEVRGVGSTIQRRARR
jgi:LmbE family N-acetylglucosaminyl deacetylase